MPKVYQLRQPPLAVDELEHRAHEAVVDAMSMSRLEDRAPRFELHARNLLPTIVRSDPDPWTWAPSERTDADGYARHGAAHGCLSAWRGEPMPAHLAHSPRLARVWSAAAMLAYLTVAEALQAARARGKVTS